MVEQKTRRVGLFGGSFNPPHVGHIDICRYLFSNRVLDEVWVIPCFQHPFGKALEPFDDRLTMSRFTFQEFGEKVKVLSIERELGGVSHTVRTIQYLKDQNPNLRFGLIVGSDVALEQQDWKDFDEITSMTPLIEVPRGAGSPITNISSTEIRRRISEGEKYDECVTTPVAVYIVTHGLYHTEPVEESVTII